MTPQEEAQRLVNRFKSFVWKPFPDETKVSNLSNAQECAHIHLDELIKTLKIHGAIVEAVAYREVKDKIDNTI